MSNANDTPTSTRLIFSANLSTHSEGRVSHCTYLHNNQISPNQFLVGRQHCKNELYKGVLSRGIINVSKRQPNSRNFFESVIRMCNFASY